MPARASPLTFDMLLAFCGLLMLWDLLCVQQTFYSLLGCIFRLTILPTSPAESLEMVKKVLARPTRHARRTDRAALGSLADNLVGATTLPKYCLMFDIFCDVFRIPSSET